MVIDCLAFQMTYFKIIIMKIGIQKMKKKIMMTKLNEEYSQVAVATTPFIYAFADSLDIPVSLIGSWSWRNNRAEFDYDALDRAKLIIFTGGEDINPKLYNQENRHSSFNDKRDYLEEKIFKQAMYLN